MPATFNVTSNFGITPPTGGFVQETSEERSVELVRLRGADANTQCAFAKKYGKISASMRGQGDMPVGALVAANITPGNITVTGKRRTEMNDDAMQFEITAEGFYNLA